MRVLGIDPGYGRVGWAIVTGNKSKQFLEVCGCIETPASKTLQERIVMVYEQVSALVVEYKPDAAGVEELYFFKNQKTVMGVGQARGAILVALAVGGVKTISYTPLQVKSAVTGYGKADKAQVERMVKAQLKLKGKITPDDASDAVAIALTHLVRSA